MSIFIYMKKLLDFFKLSINAVIWTILYITVVFCIFFFLFGFNIFSALHWFVFSKSYLHGFSGFVFFMLIISFIPVYIATIYMIYKNKKPLFNILNFEKKDTDNKEENTKQNNDEEQEQKLPEHIPSELWGAFLRSQKQSVYIKSAFDNNVTSLTENKSDDIDNKSESDLPLPESFDFSDHEESETSVPNYTDINFTDYEIESEPELDELKIVKYLEEKKQELKQIENDIVLYNEMAIITHGDSDFWITDNDNWFANGKQKKSPIETVVSVAKKHNMKPAIYLEHKNIMDLDNQIKEWESANITVIKDLEEL